MDRSKRTFIIRKSVNRMYEGCLRGQEHLFLAADYLAVSSTVIKVMENELQGYNICNEIGNDN